jgi:hypothetical protein
MIQEHTSSSISFFVNQVLLLGVGHEGVEAGHDLGALAVDELPEAVARVPLPLVKVLQDAGRSVLLGHPVGKFPRHVVRTDSKEISPV